MLKHSATRVLHVRLRTVCDQLIYLSLFRQLFPVSGVRRAMRLFHHLRYRAVSSVMLRTLMSPFTLSIQVFWGLPLSILPSTVQYLTDANASPSSLLITWPYHLSLLVLRTSLIRRNPHLLATTAHGTWSCSLTPDINWSKRLSQLIMDFFLPVLREGPDFCAVEHY